MTQPVTGHHVVDYPARLGSVKGLCFATPPPRGADSPDGALGLASRWHSRDGRLSSGPTDAAKEKTHGKNGDHIQHRGIDWSADARLSRIRHHRTHRTRCAVDGDPL